MQFDVAYAAGLSRLTTLLRLPLFIPVYVAMAAAAYLVYLGAWFGFIAVFVRQRYPGWLFDGLSGALGFIARGQSYGLLLTDRFPSFETAGSPVRLEYDRPPAPLSRWRVLIWKSILLIPHGILLGFVALALTAVTVIAWFAILFTGNYPRGLFGFSMGVQRWWFRCAGYWLSFNDRFPPVSLSPAAGPGSTASAIACGVVGLLITGGFIGAIVATATLGPNQVDASYAALQQGRGAETFFVGDRSDPRLTFTLSAITDPDAALTNGLGLGRGQRAVALTVRITDNIGRSLRHEPADYRIRWEDSEGGGHWTKATTLVVGGIAGTRTLDGPGTATIRALFVLPASATVLAFEVEPPWDSLRALRFNFED
jgi:hypothetical protein